MVSLSENGCLLSRRHPEPKKKNKRTFIMHTKTHLFKIGQTFNCECTVCKNLQHGYIMTLKISSRKKSQFPLLYYILNLHCTLKCSYKSRFTFSCKWEPVYVSVSLSSYLLFCMLHFSYVLMLQILLLMAVK